MIVAIDGPAGAGKSTVARLVAEELGFGYLNTGSMYRAVALAAHRRSVDPNDGTAVAELARDHVVRLVMGDSGECVLLDDEDVTAMVRAPEISAIVPHVAAHAPLRTIVVGWQRDVMDTGDWVVDGRDIATVVAPHAEVKVFLTASPEERSRRRHAELAASGEAPPLESVHADMRLRDARDAGRTASPMEVAEGATVVDTTGLTITEVVGAIRDLVRRAGGSA